jgi:hypothetical protein
MKARKISYLLAVLTASAMAAMLVVGTGVSSLAQVNDDSSMTGTINSLVQEDGEVAYVLGGDWQLAFEGGEITDFTADLVMVGSDGSGAHEHRIVMTEGTTSVNLADERTGTVDVVLDPTEQAVGKTVLVNASGLAAESETTVKVGEMIAGNPTSDQDGNLLFALGITEDMVGSQTVVVQDERNSGSMPLTVVELEEEASSQANITTTTTDGNQTDVQVTNATETGQTSELTNATAGTNQTETQSTNSTDGDLSSSLTNQTVYNSVIEGELYDSENEDIATSNETGSSSETGGVPMSGESEDINPDGNLTTFEEEAILAGEVFEDMPGFNDTASGTSNTTLSENVTSGIPEAEAESYTIQADIYTDGELKWEGISVTITVVGEGVIKLEIDAADTDNHFGEDPIFGLSET